MSRPIAGLSIQSPTSAQTCVFLEAPTRQWWCMTGNKAVCVSPSRVMTEKLPSTWVFSASRDKTVLMWDLNQGDEPIQEFSGHQLVVNGLAVSPDGRKLCTGSRDNCMCLWDIESAKCEQRHNISRNLVTHVCWVPGSSSIVQTSEDKTVRVWDSRAWQVTNTFPAKQYIQTHCDVSDNGNYLVSSSNGFGGQGCEATLWDLRQPGCKVVEYRGHLQTTACCVFLPVSLGGSGGAALVATSSHDSSVKVWDQNSAASTVDSITCRFSNHQGPLQPEPVIWTLEWWPASKSACPHQGHKELEPIPAKLRAYRPETAWSGHQFVAGL
ncbi:WD repeat-containing protein 31 isoform X4 [Syngnathoides biaculeatus]|uniref:WD repeat-containing protein 31 isoform X4 n=1 Tax=Syngnathoides biaculeatus TaxID=300417 RepID=UPI002ADDC980|nr:WD repeat-containing protein 31 isoform X4 [Syngnathoides biaculeatus]